MISAPLISFGGKFAIGMAAAISKAATRKITELAFGEAETKALAWCLETTIREILGREKIWRVLPDDESRGQVADVLLRIIGSESVATALVEAATTGKGDPGDLLSLMETAGLAPETVSINWPEFVAEFLSEFEKVLRIHASAETSPLKNRISLSEVFRLRCAVFALVQGVGETSPRLIEGIYHTEYRNAAERFFDGRATPDPNAGQPLRRSHQALASLGGSKLSSKLGVLPAMSSNFGLSTLGGRRDCPV